MSLAPGGLRELHWHANAAEWAYVIKGQCRVTTIDPQGHSEIVDFGPGDVWYFPRGHGHSIQGIGREDCLFVLVFDNGYFSEFGTFSISDWLGHTPPEVLAKDLRRAGADLRQFSQTRGLHRQGTGAAAAAGRSGAGLAQRRRAHPPLSAAGAAAGDVSGRHQSAGVAARIPDLDHHDRRAHAHQAGRLARAALASQCRRVAILHLRSRSHERVRIARPRPHRGIRRGRRRLRAAGLRALHRECRHRGSRPADRPQQRQLPIDLAHRLDGHQSAPLAGDQFRSAGERVREFPESERFMPL